VPYCAGLLVPDRPHRLLLVRVRAATAHGGVPAGEPMSPDSSD
jgi:hypothetical protein